MSSFFCSFGYDNHSEKGTNQHGETMRHWNSFNQCKSFFLLSIFLLVCSNIWSAPLRLEDIMSSPFPSDLTASVSGDRVVWVFNHKGVRNIWAAEGPAYTPHQVTQYSKDDGQELSS